METGKGLWNKDFWVRYNVTSINGDGCRVATSALVIILMLANEAELGERG